MVSLFFFQSQRDRLSSTGDAASRVCVRCITCVVVVYSYSLIIFGMWSFLHQRRACVKRNKIHYFVTAI
ncbi:unnamed protein product [Ixodes pacificus]